MARHEDPSRATIIALLVATLPFGTTSAAHAETQAPRTVYVRFEADDARAELQRREDRWVSGGPVRLWVPLCRERCEGPVDPTFTYRVDGPGIRTSSELGFAPGTREHVRVETAGTYRKPLGVTLVATGGGITLLGAAIGFWAATGYTEEARDSSGAAKVMAVGAALALGGLYFLMTSGTTVRRRPMPEATSARADVAF